MRRAWLWVLLTLVIIFSVGGWIGDRIGGTVGGYLVGIGAVVVYIGYWRWRWMRGAKR